MGRILKINTDTEKEEALKAAAEILLRGGVAAIPTDTVYGFAALVHDEKAIERLYRIKERSQNKSIAVLLGDAVQAPEVAHEFPAKARRLAEKYWPGALTLIFRKKPGIPDAVTAGGETIGIRMPDMELTRELIRAAGKPLAAPSANTSGKRSSVSAREVLEDLDGKIDMVIDGGTCPVGVASTVVDMTGETPVILREGVITAEMIAQA